MRNFGTLHLLLVAALLLSVIAACSDTPKGILDREKMSSLMADVYRGEAVIEFNYQNYNNDSSKKVVKQSILMAHNVSQAEFDSSLMWYGRHIEEYIKVCDRAVEILEADFKKIPDDPSGVTQMFVAGDSAEVWALPTYYRITANTPSPRLTFRLYPDDTWEPGDVYTLAVKLHNMRSPLHTTMAVNYADGGREYLNDTYNDNGWMRSTLRLDSTRTATAIYGTLDFAPESNEYIFIDSISLVRTRVNPIQYRTRRNTRPFVPGSTKTQNDKSTTSSHKLIKTIDLKQ